MLLTQFLLVAIAIPVIVIAYKTMTRKDNTEELKKILNKLLESLDFNTRLSEKILERLIEFSTTAVEINDQLSELISGRKPKDKEDSVKSTPETPEDMPAPAPKENPPSEETKTCINCGHELGTLQMICNLCGADQTVVPSEPQAESTAIAENNPEPCSSIEEISDRVNSVLNTGWKNLSDAQKQGAEAIGIKGSGWNQIFNGDRSSMPTINRLRGNTTPFKKLTPEIQQAIRQLFGLNGTEWDEYVKYFNAPPND